MSAPGSDNSQDLILAAQDGDERALDSLLARHLPGLRVFVRARSGAQLRAKESCSDLVQTVCREALGSLQQYEWRGEGSFRHWLFTLALNKIQRKANYYAAARRDVRRERDPAGLSGDDALYGAYQNLFGPSQYAIREEAVARFETALDGLPEQYREIILLSRVVGMTNAEIGDQLGKSAEAVRVTLARALARLATRMERD